MGILCEGWWYYCDYLRKSLILYPQFFLGEGGGEDLFFGGGIASSNFEIMQFLLQASAQVLQYAGEPEVEFIVQNILY